MPMCTIGRWSDANRVELERKKKPNEIGSKSVRQKKPIAHASISAFESVNTVWMHSTSLIAPQLFRNGRLTCTFRENMLNDQDKANRRWIIHPTVVSFYFIIGDSEALNECNVAAFYVCMCVCGLAEVHILLLRGNKISLNTFFALRESTHTNSTTM